MSVRATARTYWVTGPGHGEIRSEPLARPGPDEVSVRATFSGISRGTERLVRHGCVPAAVAASMRAPWQRGEFPWPVAYGYLSVGVVEQGPDQLLGRDVFCLHPHQDRYVVPSTAVTPLPDGVPPRRGVLAGTMETAVNACWDLAPMLDDRIAVVGAGMVGSCVAALLRTFPLDRLQLVDSDPARRHVADALGVDFAEPAAALGDCDAVVHTSATASGLTSSLGLLRDEGQVLEMSWYGDAEVPVPLGAGFHARRLTLRASQVSTLSPRRHGRTTRDRLRVALAALAAPELDVLISGTTAFDDIEHAMRAVLDDDTGSPYCHVIEYGSAAR